jgi:hypothetical protein
MLALQQRRTVGAEDPALTSVTLAIRQAEATARRFKAREV